MLFASWYRALLAAAIVLACASHLPASPAAAAVTAYSAPVAPPGAPAVSLHVEEHAPTGPETGAPLLLIHGLAASTYSWRQVAPELARGRRVIALDLRGYGRSEKPFDQRYSAADQAMHVVAFLARRGLKRVIIVGHSFGGAVALVATLTLNRERPGFVERLVLLDAPAYPQEATPFVRFLQKPVLPYAVLTLVPAHLAAALLFSGEGESKTPAFDVISAFAAPFYEAAARHALITTARHIRPPNWRDLVARYPTIRQPTLIVWCDRDDVVPLSSGVRLARALPNARLEVIRGCQHSPQDEKPEALLRLMRAFLERSK